MSSTDSEPPSIAGPESSGPQLRVVTEVLLRSLLGLWFAYSGGVKLFVTGLDRFTRDITNYKIVGEPWDAVAAYTVPWAELIAGLLLLAGCFRKGALTVLTGLVGVFSFSIAWAWWHQLDISCGCHGGDEKIRYWAKALELAGYALVLAFLAYGETRRNGVDQRTGECG